MKVSFYENFDSFFCVYQSKIYDPFYLDVNVRLINEDYKFPFPGQSLKDIQSFHKKIFFLQE